MKKLIKASASIAGPLSLIAGLVSDFLSPLAPFSRYIFIISLAFLLVFLLLYYFKRKSPTEDSIEKSITYKGLSFSIINSVVFGIIFILSLFVPDKGIIATTIPGLNELQTSLFRIEKGVAQVETKIDKINKKLDLEFSNIETLIKESNPIEKPKTPNDFIVNAYLFKTSGNLLKSEESFRSFINETGLEKYDLYKDYFEVLLTNYGAAKGAEILSNVTDSPIARVIIIETQNSGMEFQAKLSEVNQLDTLLRNWIETKNYRLNPGMLMSLDNLIKSDKMLKKEKSLGNNFVRVQHFFLNKMNTTSMWSDEWKSTKSTPYRKCLEYCKTYYNQLNEGFSKLDSTSLLKKKYPTLNEFIDFQLGYLLKLDNTGKSVWWYYADNPINK